MARVIDKTKIYEDIKIETEKMVNKLFEELGINFDDKSTIVVDGRDADLNTPVKPESTVIITPNIYNG